MISNTRITNVRSFLLVAVTILLCGLLIATTILPEKTKAQSGSGCAGAEVATEIQSKIEKAKAIAESGFLAAPTIDLASLSVTTKLSSRQRVECVLNSLAIIAARTALDSITQSTVNWINSGFEGSPAFVTDLQQNLRNLGDAVAEDFIRGLDQVVVSNTGLSIRAPFQDQIARQLREEFYRTTSSYGFDLRYPYRDCYGSRGFSLDGFHCQSQSPANNVYGRYELARTELFRQLDEAAQNRIREIGWGNGFLPWRGNCGRYGNTQTTADLSTAEKTKDCPIRTPGIVIEKQLSNVLGSGVRQLELADNFDAIISALATQLIGQVLGGAGLSGVAPTSSGELRPLTNGDTSAIGSQLFERNISDAREQATTYRDQWTRISEAASTAVQACGNSSRAAEATRTIATAGTKISSLNQVLTNLAQIETERARITSSGASTQQNIKELTDRFGSELSRLESIIDGSESGLYEQMRNLAASCR